jgi:hypothetical protein
MISNPHTPRFDDPQTRRDPLRGQGANRIVLCTGKTFLMHVINVPSGINDALPGQRREVLVELEPHVLHGDRYYAFVRQLSGICDGCRNMLGTKTEILLQDRLSGLACGEVVEDHVNWNTSTLKARQAVHSVRVNPDVLAPVHTIASGGVE